MRRVRQRTTRAHLWYARTQPDPWLAPWVGLGPGKCWKHLLGSLVSYTRYSMVSSTRNVRSKKNVGGRPRVGSAHFMLSVPPPLLAELDAFRDQQPVKPSRQEAIRHLLAQALSASKKRGR
jgi:hypothetical protein